MNPFQTGYGFFNAGGTCRTGHTGYDIYFFAHKKSILKIGTTVNNFSLHYYYLVFETGESRKFTVNPKRENIFRAVSVHIEEYGIAHS